MMVRFGEFEVDLETGQLLKHGIRIILRPQSRQVLAALLERPGELVTREELRDRLWRQDTFVDFEVGLNSAISRLRRVLGDSVESPHYIETIPKGGYRFIGPVPNRTAVAVMPFLDLTTDRETEAFSDGLTAALIRSLSRLERLKVSAMSVALRLKGQPHDAKQIGRQLAVQTVVEGSIQRSGGQVRVIVHLVSAKDGFDLWAQRFDGETTDVFALQDEICGTVTDALKIRLLPRPGKDCLHDEQDQDAVVQMHRALASDAEVSMN